MCRLWLLDYKRKYIKNLLWDLSKYKKRLRMYSPLDIFLCWMCIVQWSLLFIACALDVLFHLFSKLLQPSKWRIIVFKKYFTEYWKIWSETDQIRSNIIILMILIWSKILIQVSDLDLILDPFLGWSDLKWSEIFRS